MKGLGKVLVFLFLFGLIWAPAGPCFADQSSVTLDAPESANKGSVITIRANVSHKGNSIVHYTDWLYIKVNGIDAARIEYTPFNRPNSENFSIEIKYPVSGPMEITAEAHCNIHGSGGVARRVVKVQ